METPPLPAPDWVPVESQDTQPLQTESQPHEAPRTHPTRTLAGAVALVLAGAAAGAGIAHSWHQGSSTATTALLPSVGNQAPQLLPQQPSNGGNGTDAGSQSAAAIANAVAPGIVEINTTLGFADGRAAGTGMVLTSNGEVLTNNHVISGATSISATDEGNGRTYQATVVGYDKAHDVAVLQLKNASGLTTIKPAPQPAQVGADVVGIGNAGGQGTPSYAGGAVTALEQSITASDASDGSSEQLTGLIETNANIVAGDSGGPLANAQGQVVGMDTAASAGFRMNGGSDAYAIPIDDALTIAQQIESGQASDTVHIGPTAMLGIGVQPDESGSSSGSSGAVVAQVIENGPAAAAGISAGDTIVAVGDQSVSSASELSNVMLQQKPGTDVNVQYVDESGTQHTTTVHLATGPAQ
jgi:S1-C subfamily serine protease